MGQDSQGSPSEGIDDGRVGPERPVRKVEPQGWKPLCQGADPVGKIVLEMTTSGGQERRYDADRAAVVFVGEGFDRGFEARRGVL